LRGDVVETLSPKVRQSPYSTAKRIRTIADDFLQSLRAAMGHRAEARVKSIHLQDRAQV
jgi:hypothetical protein